MKITGTEQEIKWILSSLANACEDCPFSKSCEEKARENVKETGKVKLSCIDYLMENVKFDIEK